MRRLLLALVSCCPLMAFAADDAIVTALKSKVQLADMKNRLGPGILVTRPGTPLVVQKEGLFVGWAGTPRSRRLTRLENGEVVTEMPAHSRPLRQGERVFIYKVESMPTVLTLSIVTADTYATDKSGHGEQRIEFAYDTPLAQVGTEKVLEDVGEWLRTEEESSIARMSVEPAQASGADCRPDELRDDKITKERVVIWSQNLFETSFAGSLWGSSEVTIMATVGRYGSVNAISLQIQKREASADSASFDTAYRGIKGQPFYLGMKDSPPVVLTVTDVSNESRLGYDFLDKKAFTTVVLSAAVSNDELGRLRPILTSTPVDALRASFAGGLRIEKDVSEKSGRKLMEKFRCFFESLDAGGVSLSTSDSNANTPTEESPETRLQKLKSLFDKGLISKEEYESKRAEILKAM